MSTNPLRRLADHGQSVWLDFISRNLITSGGLQRLIVEDDLRGVTSNPAIFEKSIAGSADYDEAIQALARDGRTPLEVYEALAVEDVQRAADAFTDVYRRTKGDDGYVSLEVNPHLAHDTQGTIDEARRLWRAVDRPNVMIKVPGTRAGLPAIRRLIAEGININVTLLFAIERYRDVAKAYVAGLEDRKASGQPLERVRSVASFFLSRIDTLIDPMLEKIAKGGGKPAEAARALRGEAAIASARLAYAVYREVFGGERFRGLTNKGAAVQRLLWASTSTKNPDYSDTKYVEPLIGPHTVNTMPQETIDAYRDHGQPAARIEEGLEQARRLPGALSALGIELDAITQRLEEEGVEKFNKPFDALQSVIATRCAAAAPRGGGRVNMHLGSAQAAVDAQVAGLDRAQFLPRLQRRDGTLWKGDPTQQQQIGESMGWLECAERIEEDLDTLRVFAEGVKRDGFTHVVHMGMGGSSLAPMVLQHALGTVAGGLPVIVLDTTDPATIAALERRIPLERTLFIVASKSGTTGEPLAFGDYFYERVRAARKERAGRSFIAITDPGTPLVEQARERGYRAVFLNFADVGGRYSALTYFGIVPAVLMGWDVAELLTRARRLQKACAAAGAVASCPAARLGATLGALAKKGRDKVTFACSPTLAILGTWLEQLIAESTGKEGMGLLPVAGEPLGPPEAYGEDRVFVSIAIAGEAEATTRDRLAVLSRAGHPVIEIELGDRLDLGAEFLRWEIATAAAGAVLAINPFDQPNVQESKDNTTRLLKTAREGGRLPEGEPAVAAGPLTLFAQAPAASAEAALAEILGQIKPNDYVAILAYLTEDDATVRRLESLRLNIRDRLHVATTLGFGPRYLHSTGQYHKGGPANGVFLEITADDARDVAIPQRPYGFSVFCRAQALGDLQALWRHRRRALRIHLSGDRQQALAALERALGAAVSDVAGAACARSE
jgi:transaldolase/glucose-6-phosphate isomerase